MSFAQLTDRDDDADLRDIVGLLEVDDLSEGKERVARMISDINSVGGDGSAYRRERESAGRTQNHCRGVLAAARH